MTYVHPSLILLQSALLALHEPRFSSNRIKAAAPYLPYVLKREPQGFLLLNRGYKPLGLPASQGCGWVDYALFPGHTLPLDLLSGVAVDAVGSRMNPDGSIWLWSDWSAPWMRKETLRLYRSRVRALISVVQSRIQEAL